MDFQWWKPRSAEYYLKLVDFDYKQIIENNILAIK